MSRYEVDSAQVAQASATVRTSVETVRAEVAAMMRHLTDLQLSWKGAAATAFTGVITDWQATQLRVEQSLEHINGALAAAGQGYAEAETQATRLFTAGA